MSRVAGLQPGGWVTAYVALGSNLGDPVGQLRRALVKLGQLPDTRLIRASRFYRSAPLGPLPQPDYVNAVVGLDTALAPLELLSALQGIERAHGRVAQTRRWMPRPLDLDLLLYEDRQIQELSLTVPHPGMVDRDFVLVPLADLDPSLTVPGLGAIGPLLDRCPKRGLVPIEATP